MLAVRLTDFCRPTLSPTTQGCGIDIDCPGKLVCFSANRTQWVKRLYGEFASFCDCARNGLHSGYPDCSVPSRGYTAELLARVLQYILLIGLVGLCLWNVIRLKRISHLTWDKPTAQTTVYVLIASVCHIIAITFTWVCVLPSTPQTLVVGFKICSRSTELLVFTVFATLFSFLSHANVAVVWINLVMTSKNLKLTRFDTGKRLKLMLYGLQVVYFVVLSTASGLLQLNVALLATIPYAIILFVGFFFGGRALAALLRESIAFSSGNSDPARSNLLRSLRRVQRVTQLMMVLLLLIIVTIGMTGIFLSWSYGFQYEQDFLVRPASVSFILVQFIIYFLNWVVMLYIHVSITTSVQGSSQRSGSVDIPPPGAIQGVAGQTPAKHQPQVLPETKDDTAIIPVAN